MVPRKLLSNKIWLFGLIIVIFAFSSLNANRTYAYTPSYLIIVHGSGATAQDSAVQSVVSWYKNQHFYADVYAPEYYPSAYDDGEINWDQEWDRSIAYYAQILYNKIKTRLYSFAEGKIDIVAHSMGGLVVRYMMKHYVTIDSDGNAWILYTRYQWGVPIPYKAHKIDDIILIGTPNEGTKLADYINGNNALPRQAVEMKTNSNFLNDLNSGDWTPSNANWYKIAGKGHGYYITTSIWGVDIPLVANWVVFGTSPNDGIVQYSSAITLYGSKGLKVYDTYNHVEIFTKSMYYCFTNWLAEELSGGTGGGPTIG